MNKSNLILLVIVALFAIKLIVVGVDNSFGGIQFVSPRIHGISMMLFFWLPVLAIRYCMKSPTPNIRKWGSLTVSLFAVITCMISILYFCINNAFFIRDKNLAVELVGENNVCKSKLKAYRINYGITTDYDIAIRQEFNLLPGIIWVRDIDDISSAHDVKIEILDRNMMRCIFLYRGHIKEIRNYNIL